MAIKVPVGYDTDGAQLDRDMTSDVSKAGGKAGAAGGKATSKAFSSSFRSGVKGVLGGLGLAAGLSEAKQFLGDSLAEAREAQKVGAATDLLVRKLGKSAGVTSKGIDRLSNSIGKNTAIDDELVATGANVLLGFKNIRNEIGKGNAVFDRATAAAVDLSATPLFKGNLTAASKALGKALADPEKGLTALGRVGIKFNAQQTERIKNYAKEGDALSAQKIILKEIESRYKGTAASQATSSDKARFAINNLKEEIGNELLPVVDDLARFAAEKAVPAISDFIKEFQNGTGTAGEIRDVLEDVGDVLKTVTGFFNGLPGPVKKTVVQLGLAYGAVRLLNSGFTAVGNSGAANFARGLGNAQTRLDTVKKSAFQAGGGIRNLAGAGGMLALQQATQQSSRELGLLTGAIGGAATGFAIAGAPGAGVGAVAGALLGVFTSGKKAAVGISAADQASKDAIAGLDSLDSSLTDVTAGYTKAAKAAISQSLISQPGLVDDANKLGLSIRTLTNAQLGSANAQEKVDAAIAKYGQTMNGTVPTLDAFGRLTYVQSDAQLALAGSAGNVARAMGVTADKTKEERKQAILASLANTELGKSLKGIPDETILKIGLEGDKQARADIKNLIRDGDVVNRKQVRLLLKTAGLPSAEKDIDRIIRQANKAAREYLLQFRAQYNPAQGQKNQPGARAMGGPVRAGVPYIVGERRPEVFVPNQSGRIEPDVGRYMSSVPQAAPTSNLTIIQNDYGPRTGRAKINEIVWATKYATHARGYQGEAS